MDNKTIDSKTLEELLADRLAIESLTFEDGIKLLERLVQAVESGSLPLETAITSYEKGSVLLKHLKGKLSGAEERLKILKNGELEESNEPF